MRSYREIALEDGESGMSAWLVVDATDREISFGGTRIDPLVTRAMVSELAENMSLKLAGHGSPVGGAKAGLRASPDDPRLTEYLHRFARACSTALSSTTILGKDMGAKQWMLDEIYKSLNLPQLAVARKRLSSAVCPDRLGDLDGYIPDMTGQGVFWAIEQALDGAVRGTRVLIQGFGVVGAGVARHLTRAGAIVTGVSDVHKAVVAANGLDVDALIAAKDDSSLLVESRLPTSCRVIARDGLLTHDADVLVLAAGSYVVDGETSARIRTPLVIEAANVALVTDSRARLHARGVRVVPDVVANSSSAALVGHQIASGNRCAPRELWAHIERSIKANTAAVHRASRALDVDSKEAFRQLMSTKGPARHA